MSADEQVEGRVHENLVGRGEQERLADVHRRLNEAFWSGKTLKAAWRRQQLRRLLDMFTENKERLVGAVQRDLGKQHPQEALVTEYNFCVHEIREALSHLDFWMQPTDAPTPISCQPAKSQVFKAPLGVVLIMSPWNYPINLAIVPLIGALAAGNCVFLKLSPYSAHSAAALFELLPRYVDMECLGVEAVGGREVITPLIQLKWDHIFFTGSCSVGKIVYRAAAEHLTPCTLELGGKNPCFVDATIDLRLAAKRIAWGKWFNTGQTCLGVDYVLVEDAVHDRLVDALRDAVRSFYGDEPRRCESYGRIITEAAATRLQRLLAHGTVVHGGDVDVADKYVAPTIIVDPQPDSELMTDEIFGPILPVVRIPSVADGVRALRDRPVPLALYLFSSDKRTHDMVLSQTRSGACLINEVLLHFVNPDLPFGGCGESGLGAYHGDRTFQTFTHSRAVMKATDKNWLDVPLRYPPYSTASCWLVDQVTRRGL